MTAVTHDDDPLVLSSLLSILLGSVAIALIATASWQQAGLVVVLFGVTAAWSGIQLARGRRRLFGGSVGLLGVGIALVGVARVGLGSGSFSALVEVLPGLVGLVVLVAGLAPVRRGWERRCLALGTALILSSVVASGIVYGTDAPHLLGASVATMLAWDCGEQGINLAEHAGRQTRTIAAELPHNAAGAVVGGFALVVALGIRHVDVGSLPFVGLVGLLVAVLALGLALSS